MTVKIITVAEIGEEVVQEWLQYLRDFDVKHPGCHFQVTADAPAFSLEEMQGYLANIKPPLPVVGTIFRKGRPQ
jgi:hypothetical protein